MRLQSKALLAIGLLDFALVSAYQLGWLRHLPDPPPRSVFNSDRVSSSRKAYHFGIPDGPLGLGYYLGLWILKSESRNRPPRQARTLQLAFATAGALMALKGVRDMALKLHAYSPYALVGALVNFSLLLKASLRNLDSAAT